MSISFNPTAQILRLFLRPGRSKSATDAREQEGGWLVWVLVQYEMTLSGPLRQLAAAFLSFPCLREDQGSLPRAVPVPAHSTLSLVKKRNTDPVVRPDECHHSGYQQARHSSPPCGAGRYMYLLLCLGMYLPPISRVLRREICFYGYNLSGRERNARDPVRLRPPRRVASAVRCSTCTYAFTSDQGTLDVCFLGEKGRREEGEWL